MIYETLLRINSLNGANRGLAERPDLELCAVRPNEPCGAQPALPILAALSKLHPTIVPIVVNPKKTGHASLHRVTNIVDVEFVAIAPTMKTADCLGIVSKEATLQARTGSRLR